MRHTLTFFLLCILTSATCQISEILFDFDIEESFLGVDQVAENEYLLAGFSGSDTDNLVGRITKYNTDFGITYSDVFGDPGKSRYTSIASWNEIPVVGAGLVNLNLGNKTNFNAVTFKRDGSPNVIFETHAWMGADNTALDIETTDNGLFIAAGEINFDFGLETYKTPHALIASLDVNNSGVVSLESWSVPEHGLGSFIKVVVESDYSVFLLFKEEDPEGFHLGYKVFNYALPSGELQHWFSVDSLSTINDFSLGHDGNSFLFVGSNGVLSQSVAQIVQTDIGGTVIQSKRLDKMGTTLKGIKIASDFIIGAGEITYTDVYTEPFFWQLDRDLRSICYKELKSEQESLIMVNDIDVGNSMVAAVGSKLLNNGQASALWQTELCSPNSTSSFKGDQENCMLINENGCYSIKCDNLGQSHMIRLFDLSGKLLSEGVTDNGMWCSPISDYNGMLIYNILSLDDHQLLGRGKVYSTYR